MKKMKKEQKKRFQEYFHFGMPVKFYGSIFEGMHTMHILANERERERKKEKENCNSFTLCCLSLAAER